MSVSRTNRFALTLTLSLSLLLAVLAGCNGGQEGPSEADVDRRQGPPTPAPDDYPLDVCVVSGQKLGSMGEPVVITHEGQEVRFCCAGCIDAFKADPQKYLRKIADARADRMSDGD
jgi:YHS domain-containing protein